ncbi:MULTISPECIES: hypothetical protein [unclassified Saccharibacter]|uniref:hypothetical protein n=1 Tax=unclassified Saccharibacter TaxID=2648722 RepID=UPI00132135A2|nr:MULTISPECIES: hypothetical protein [unclassified Saccharibacter]MXV36604.1 hypothetical protein [Saccharibacter sp. EH611]MXV58836.1 hypothetical protein [Saccharibacter sp. EH70]MXV65492.1 hypothetical protein [Saccharibacter sp. EH60]
MGASDIEQGLAESGPNGESNQQFSTPKWLTGLVIFMGVLIVIGTAALLWVIVSRMMHPHPERAAAHAETGAVASFPTMPAMLTVPRHGEEQIRAVVPRSDGTLAVTLMAPQGGGRVVLWMPEQARIVAEFDLGSGAP